MSLVPPMPPAGSVVADLATLKRYLGVRGTVDDALLDERLTTARWEIYHDVLEDRWGLPAVQEAVVVRAAELYKRRQTRDGQGGVPGETPLFEVGPRGADVEQLIGPHLDWSKVGVA